MDARRKVHPVLIRLDDTEFRMLRDAGTRDGHLQPGVEARRLVLKGLGLMP